MCSDLTKVTRKDFAFCRIIEFLYCVILKIFQIVDSSIERGVDLPK